MKTLLGSALGLAMMSGVALADGHGGWVSVADESALAFGSVKKDTAGEVHHFNALRGTVSDQGAVTIEIDLTSLETYIDIRNERIAEHVFKGATTATLSGEVDMEEIRDLGPGETTITGFEGRLQLGGREADIEADMLVARLGDTRVLVSTADFIMLSTADLGIDAGVDKLMELASLPGITRVTPVSIRMVFEQ